MSFSLSVKSCCKPKWLDSFSRPQETIVHVFVHPELLADGKTPKGKLVNYTEGVEVRKYW